MEGEDINDSNCINFSTISKIRDPTRIFDSKSGINSLKGVKIGIVNEFDIEELDPRNRNIQSEL